MIDVNKGCFMCRYIFKGYMDSNSPLMFFLWFKISGSHIIMQMKTEKNHQLFRPIILSIAAAGSLAGLIILTAWGFEFRSFVKLLLQAAPIAVPLSIIFYFGIFRRVDYLKQFSPWLWLSEAFAAYIISSQIVPAQINFDRYVTTIALVSSLLLIFLSCVISFLFFSRNFPWKTIFIVIILLS